LYFILFYYLYSYYNIKTPFKTILLANNLDNNHKWGQLLDTFRTIDWEEWEIGLEKLKLRVEIPIL